MAQKPYTPDSYQAHQLPSGNDYTPINPYEPTSNAYTYGRQLEQGPSKKHSGLGIASFGISLLAGVGLIVLFVIAGLLEASTPGGIDDSSPILVVIGLVLFALLFLALLGLGFGVGSLFQSTRNKLFGILGIGVSVSTFFSFVALMVISVLI